MSTKDLIKKYIVCGISSMFSNKEKEDGIESVYYELQTGKHFKTNNYLSKKEIKDRIQGLIDYGYEKSVVYEWLGDWYYE